MDHPLYEIDPTQFPGSLTEITDPPQRLFVRGTLPPQDHTFLAVVGSRQYTAYGEQVTQHLLAGLRGYPVTIVSGLAIGIDAIAHKAALTHGINTIAIPGSGLNDEVLYPRTNRDLAHRILNAGGTLISEFEPSFTVTRWCFTQRNRIVAGIVRAVLVIEATRQSGTLITARLATEYDRDVLVVPGSIFSPTSDGPHLMLSIGATPITTPNELLDALDLLTTPS